MQHHHPVNYCLPSMCWPHLCLLHDLKHGVHSPRLDQQGVHFCVVRKVPDHGCRAVLKLALQALIFSLH